MTLYVWFADTPFMHTVGMRLLSTPKSDTTSGSLMHELVHFVRADGIREPHIQRHVVSYLQGGAVLQWGMEPLGEDALILLVQDGLGQHS